MTNAALDIRELLLADETLNAVIGGARVNQYDVQPGRIYKIYFPCQHGPFNVMPYGDRSGNTYRIAVYEVFEADGMLFGTNRTVRGIDVANGEYVEVRINCDNVYTDN